MDLPQLPKGLFSKMKELKDGHFEFDTSAPGPFLLPEMAELVSIDKVNQNLLILVFRDKAEGKRFDVPIDASLLPSLTLTLQTMQQNWKNIGNY